MMVGKCPQQYPPAYRHITPLLMWFGSCVKPLVQRFSSYGTFSLGLPQVKSIQTKILKNQRRVESTYSTRYRQYYVQDVNIRTHRLQEHVNKEICLLTDTILKIVFYGECKFSPRSDLCKNIKDLLKPLSFKSYHFTATPWKWKTWRFLELWYLSHRKRK